MPSPFVPIFVAEAASSLVSLGAVLTVSHFETSLAPVRHFIAKKVIYPVTMHKQVPDDIDHHDPDYKKACDRAGMLIKGGAMIGAGIASHIPIQRMLEGHGGGSLMKVARGKFIGVGVALGCVAVLKNKTHMISSAENAVTRILGKFMPTSTSEKIKKQVSELTVTDGVSSGLSGLGNLLVTTGTGAAALTGVSRFIR